MPATEHQLPLRVVLRRPPAGVRFAMQHGAAKAGGLADIVDVQEADGRGDLAFECVIRVQPREDGTLRFLGPSVHGATSARFLYITVGKRAGQPTSPWDRRAKIPLSGITPALLRSVLATPGAVLEATIEGTLPDGSPTCATRPFAEGGAWAVRSGRRAARRRATATSS